MSDGVDTRGSQARRKRVLAFVAAHPDDDIMGVAGLIALHRSDPDLRFVLVHATDGEAGEIAPGSGATRATLGAVRRDEDRRSWEVIGRVPDRHEWLGFPDGAVAALPAGVLTTRIADIFAQERPDVVLTSGPDGITGHPDHVAVGAAASEAFLKFAGSEPGFRRLFHAAYPQSALDRTNAWRVATGRPPWDPSVIYHPRGVPDELIDCTIDQKTVMPLIVDAFREHRTQWAPPWSENVDKDWRAAAGACHLVQAWPPREPGAPVLADPFDGL